MVERFKHWIGDRCKLLLAFVSFAFQLSSSPLQFWVKFIFFGFFPTPPPTPFFVRQINFHMEHAARAGRPQVSLCFLCSPDCYKLPQWTGLPWPFTSLFLVWNRITYRCSKAEKLQTFGGQDRGGSSRAGLCIVLSCSPFDFKPLIWPQSQKIYR